MNNLSWLLYWGGVAGNLGGFLTFVGGINLAVGIVYFTVYQVNLSDLREVVQYRSGDDDDKYEKLLNKPSMPLMPIFFLFLSVVMWICACFCPSQQTVYAIAASQVGQSVVQSPLGDKAEQAIESWLNRQIALNNAPEKSQ